MCNPQNFPDRNRAERTEYYTFFPTRVLDVWSDDMEPESLRLLENDTKIQAPYVALSHCWGNSSHFTTTSTNIHGPGGRLDMIRFSDLPKTFADAVIITRNFGLRYLWIDSLCIIQDDKQDWSREAAVMGQLYHNAFVTIAASAAPNDRSIGCLFDRSGGIDDLVEVPYWTPDEQIDGCIFIHERPPGYVNCQSESPLQKRAWTLQERLLSPRTVNFTFRQVYFECVKERIGEDHAMLRMSDMSADAKKALFLHADGENHANQPNNAVVGWLELVQEYTKRNITYDTDILPALSGMASHLQKMLNRGQYVAGIWKGSIHHDLCWKISGNNSRRIIPPEHWRAPSWSWASTQGGVDYRLGTRYGIVKASEVPVFISNITMSAEKATIDENGELLSASLTLSGWISEQKQWLKVDNSSPWADQHDIGGDLPRIDRISNMIQRSRDEKAFSRGYASPDALYQSTVIFDDPREKSDALFVLPIKRVDESKMEDYEGPDQLRYSVAISLALVPVKVEAQNKVFKRVGIGYMIWPKKDKGNVVEITII